MRAILVVDDEADVRRLVARMLTRNGYRVHTADNRENARKLIEDNPDTELLLSDVNGPGMNGPLIAEEIAAIKPDIKVLFMTGFDGAQLVQRCIVEKGYKVIVKPFTLDELAAKVRAVLGDERTQINSVPGSELS